MHTIIALSALTLSELLSAYDCSPNRTKELNIQFILQYSHNFRNAMKKNANKSIEANHKFNV